MKAATIHEIKQELTSAKPAELVELCLRLARFKKENKELLTYLLFEAHNEQSYIESIKEDMQLLFNDLPRGNTYYVKKSLRKILRFTNRQIRYSGLPETELELRIFFCAKVKEARIPLHGGTVLYNLYSGQLKKINSIL